MLKLLFTRKLRKIEYLVKIIKDDFILYVLEIKIIFYAVVAAVYYNLIFNLIFIYVNLC